MSPTDITKTLDAVVKSGKPRVLRWHGAALRIMPSGGRKKAAGKKKPALTAAQWREKRRRWLENITPGKGFILCDPEELVHMDWSE